MVGKADKRISEFMKKVRKRFKVEKAILFGSRARGDYFENSDYDILIVSGDFKGTFFTHRMAKLYEFWEHECDLEPLCYTIEEFEKKRKQLGIVQDAVKEGVEV